MFISLHAVYSDSLLYVRKNPVFLCRFIFDGPEIFTVSRGVPFHPVILFPNRFSLNRRSPDMMFYSLKQKTVGYNVLFRQKIPAA